MSLESLSEKIKICEKCSLHRSRDHAVPGEGPWDPQFMIVGETPGSTDDEIGQLFMGKTGEFLTAAMEEVGLDRKKFFITPTVKCKPPANRPPKHDEIEKCLYYLLDQIVIIRPKAILVLGEVALKSLLDEKSIVLSRGKIIKKGDIKYLPTFHPTAAMRNSKKKEKFFKDLKLFKKAMK